MNEEEFRGRPVDPITTEEQRATLVRNALSTLHMSDAITIEEHWAIGRLLDVCSDATLATLGRMLR